MIALKFKKLESNGFGHVELFSALAIIAVVAVAGIYVSKHNSSHALTPSVAKTGLYEALGDSFTAQDSLTKWNQKTCEVAPTTYPSIVASDLKLNEENLACSGASTLNLLTDSQIIGDQPQLNETSSSATAISVLIGLNDFGDIPYDLVGELAGCETYNSKNPTNMESCQNEPEMDNADIGSQDQAFDNNYQSIVQWLLVNRPNAHLYLLSYPALIGTSSCPTNYLTPSDVTLYGGLFSSMNQFIHGEQLSVNSHGQNLATYVDLYTPSLGSNGCPLWVAPGTSAAPILPNHPTQAGVKDMAKVVEKAMKSAN